MEPEPVAVAGMLRVVHLLLIGRRTLSIVFHQSQQVTAVNR